MAEAYTTIEEFIPTLENVERSIEHWNNTHSKKVNVTTEMFVECGTPMFLIKANYAVKASKEDNK